MERPDLTPAIVQDAESNRVLMLAWMDEEALRRTRESGEAWFWSRSREAYWRKGETSGNTLAVEELREDCDGDTILLRVRPAGPVCHTGTESCFAPWLWRVITERGLQRPEGSYVVTLLDDPSLAARKVGEEGLEAALAGAGESDRAARGGVGRSLVPQLCAAGRAGARPSARRRRARTPRRSTLLENLSAPLMVFLGRPGSLAAWTPNPPGSRRRAIELRRRRRCSPPRQRRSSRRSSSVSA